MNLTAPVVVSGFVADRDSYLVVRASKPHRGIPGMGKGILPGEKPAHGLDIRVDFTQMIGFEITGWARGATADNSSFEGAC